MTGARNHELAIRNGQRTLAVLLGVALTATALTLVAAPARATTSKLCDGPVAMSTNPFCGYGGDPHEPTWPEEQQQECLGIYKIEEIPPTLNNASMTACYTYTRYSDGSEYCDLTWRFEWHVPRDVPSKYNYEYDGWWEKDGIIQGGYSGGGLHATTESPTHEEWSETFREEGLEPPVDVGVDMVAMTDVIAGREHGAYENQVLTCSG